MSEPTKEAIEEAKTLLEQFSGGSAFLTATELAQLIAKVKNDALERAAAIADGCEKTSPVKQRQIAAAQIAARIRAKKVPS